jgi:hypothetical protein
MSQLREALEKIETPVEFMIKYASEPPLKIAFRSNTRSTQLSMKEKEQEAIERAPRIVEAVRATLGILPDQKCLDRDGRETSAFERGLVYYSSEDSVRIGQELGLKKAFLPNLYHAYCNLREDNFGEAPQVATATCTKEGHAGSVELTGALLYGFFNEFEAVAVNLSCGCPLDDSVKIGGIRLLNNQEAQ